MPVLQDGEEIAVDLHTHGRLPAWFSATDDADDRGIKIAGVFGHLHEPVPTAAFRLVLNGWTKALPHPASVARAWTNPRSPRYWVLV
jgi:PRTRC genetic system protein A